MFKVTIYKNGGFVKILILILLFGSLGFSQTQSLNSNFLSPGVGYIASGGDVILSSASSTAVLSRTNTAGKTFYLDMLFIEAAPNAISGTGVHLGTCALQSPIGSSVMTFNFNNSTASQIDRLILEPTYPIPISSSFQISCWPASSTAGYWNVNYSGFEN